MKPQLPPREPMAPEPPPVPASRSSRRAVGSVGVLVAACLAAGSLGAKKGCFQVKPVEPICIDAAEDCAGLTPDVDCIGHWSCSKTASCEWICDPAPQWCDSDLDCKPGDACVCETNCGPGPIPCFQFCSCEPSGPPADECMGDQDCPKGQICTVPDDCFSCSSCPECDVCCGKCVDAPPEPIWCNSDLDCKPNESCVCEADCGFGPVPCLLECTCQPNLPELGECMSDAECPKGEVCSAPDTCLACASCPICAVCCGMCEPAPVEQTCFVGGCSGQLCSPTPGLPSTCEWLPWYQCFQLTECGAFGSNGACEWEKTKEFVACMAANGAPGYAQPTCFVGGCSGQICSSDPGAISTCEFFPWYMCYSLANCATTPAGKCGWQYNDAFLACWKEKGGPTLQ